MGAEATELREHHPTHCMQDFQSPRLQPFRFGRNQLKSRQWKPDTTIADPGNPNEPETSISTAEESPALDHLVQYRGPYPRDQWSHPAVLHLAAPSCPHHSITALHQRIPLCTHDPQFLIGAGQCPEGNGLDSWR